MKVRCTRPSGAPVSSQCLVSYERVYEQGDKRFPSPPHCEGCMCYEELLSDPPLMIQTTPELMLGVSDGAEFKVCDSNRRYIGTYQWDEEFRVFRPIQCADSKVKTIPVTTEDNKTFKVLSDFVSVKNKAYQNFVNGFREITVNELLRKKTELEIEIDKFLSEKVEQFHSDTGIRIDTIRIDMHTLDMSTYTATKHMCYIDKVKLSLDLESEEVK